MEHMVRDMQSHGHFQGPKEGKKKKKTLHVSHVDKKKKNPDCEKIAGLYKCTLIFRIYKPVLD